MGFRLQHIFLFANCDRYHSLTLQECHSPTITPPPPPSPPPSSDAYHYHSITLLTQKVVFALMVIGRTSFLWRFQNALPCWNYMCSKILKRLLHSCPASKSECNGNKKCVYVCDFHECQGPVQKSLFSSKD